MLKFDLTVNFDNGDEAVLDGLTAKSWAYLGLVIQQHLDAPEFSESDRLIASVLITAVDIDVPSRAAIKAAEASI